jgi:hypothetical protein
MECQICTEKYTKIRKEIICTCQFKACSKCIKTYILESPRYPGCMNCNCEWTDDFIIKNLTYSFYSKDMADKVKSLIIEDEKALIPNDMAEAERIKNSKKYATKLAKYKKRKDIAHIAYNSVITNLEKHQNGLFDSRLYFIVDDDPDIISLFYLYDRILIRATDTIRRELFNKSIDEIKVDIKSKINMWKTLLEYFKNGKIIHYRDDLFDSEYYTKLPRMLEELEEYYLCYYSCVIKQNLIYNNMNISDDLNNVPRERKEFIMKCTKEGCNSLISNKYKCPMCSSYTCKECHVNIATHDDLKVHECDQNTVETIKLIKKETKQCPKCNINITKIIGCNHMFCTNCNTKFEWNSLRIITRGSFHNPHYSEYKAKGGILREATDIVCGGVPYVRTIGLDPSLKKRLNNLSNGIEHIRINTMRDLPTEDLNKLREIRIKFIIGEYDEKKWKSELFKIRKKCSFNRNMYQILDMYTNCTIYILKNIIIDGVAKSEDYEAQKIELINLYKYAEEQVSNLCKIYKYSNSYLDNSHLSLWTKKEIKSVQETDAVKKS